MPHRLHLRHQGEGCEDPPRGAGCRARRRSVRGLDGRDTWDLYTLVEEITQKGAAVEFVSERITVDCHGASPLDALMLGFIAAFAEFDRRRIQERQAEGGGGHGAHPSRPPNGQARSDDLRIGFQLTSLVDGRDCCTNR